MSQHYREVIPKILQSVEPLSCDYRIPRKEIKNAEVPRLVSTLIGCSYDELINRQRQFKMKRLTAIFAMFMTVAVGFGAYMAYSNKKQSTEEHTGSSVD